MQIYLKKEIVTNKDLTPKAKSVYVALRKIYKQEQSEYYLTTTQIFFTLTGHLNCDRYKKTDIANGLNELIFNNIIKEVKRINQQEGVFDLSPLFFKNEDTLFVIVDDINIFQVMQCEANKHNLLMYYLYRICSITTSEFYNINNSKRHKDVGYMPQNYFVDTYNIPQKTIYNYNQILEDAKLIYIYKPVIYQNIDNNIVSFAGCYGEYKNKEKIIECGKELEAEIQGIKYKQKSSSTMRSLANKFRYIRDEGKEYDYNTMKEIYLAMVKRNKELRSHYHDDVLYNNYKKDLTIFKKYDFYEEDIKINE